jgi:uncharacterized protein (UPF0332 family)
MDKATRALASGRLLLADGDIDGACNRAYYAMFDAARAALSFTESGISGATPPKTHAGLISAFSLQLVKPGILPTDLGKNFNRAAEIRFIADYTGDEVAPEKAAWLISQAEEFVQIIQSSLFS